MSKQILTFDEFADKFIEENGLTCECGVISVPPFALCDGSLIEMEYENYLKQFEEGK